jgi:hypothetical protein
MKGNSMQPDRHISDQELMMAVDGELPARRLAKVHSHLAACEQCRSRSRDIGEAIAEYSLLHRSGYGQLPSAMGPRNLLRARLAALAEQSPLKTAPKHWIWATAAAAILVLLAGLTILPRVTRDRQEALGVIPNARLTPGAVVSTDERNVCSAVSLGSARVIPAAMGQRVFEEYGIHSPQPRAYELDYLIAPELGGSGDIRNVWPQPYSATVWNSHLKDALEGRLHDLVCSGRIPLVTAQHDIATNWVAAYKKYFQTLTPLPDHYAVAKDMPWVE